MPTTHTSAPVGGGGGGSGQEQARVGRHRFPLHSHPMFRQAVHSRAAVEKQLAGQLADPALARALDAMAEELLAQEAAGASEEEMEMMLQYNIEVLLNASRAAAAAPAADPEPAQKGSSLDGRPPPSSKPTCQVHGDRRSMMASSYPANDSAKNGSHPPTSSSSRVYAEPPGWLPQPPPGLVQHAAPAERRHLTVTCDNNHRREQRRALVRSKASNGGGVGGAAAASTRGLAPASRRLAPVSTRAAVVKEGLAPGGVSTTDVEDAAVTTVSPKNNDTITDDTAAVLAARENNSSSGVSAGGGGTPASRMQSPFLTSIRTASAGQGASGAGAAQPQSVSRGGAETEWRPRSGGVHPLPALSGGYSSELRRPVRLGGQSALECSYGSEMEGVTAAAAGAGGAGNRRNSTRRRGASSSQTQQEGEGEEGPAHSGVQAQQQRLVEERQRREVRDGVWRDAARAAVYSLLLHRRSETAGDGPAASRGGGGVRGGGVAPEDMSRGPGALVCQQSVDAAMLLRSRPEVFQSLDVLLDGNSTCISRRRNLNVTAHGTAGPRVAPLTLANARAAAAPPLMPDSSAQLAATEAAAAAAAKDDGGGADGSISVGGAGADGTTTTMLRHSVLQNVAWQGDPVVRPVKPRRRRGGDDSPTGAGTSGVAASAGTARVGSGAAAVSGDVGSGSVRGGGDKKREEPVVVTKEQLQTLSSHRWVAGGGKTYENAIRSLQGASQ